MKENSKLLMSAKKPDQLLFWEDFSSSKIVNGNKTRTVAFFGSSGDSMFSSVGVGFATIKDGKDPFQKENWSSAEIWGLVVPHCIIQSWRAMKILQETPVVDRSTLCHCWYAGGWDNHKDDERRVDELAATWDSVEEFNTRRNAILEMLPSNEVLEQVITAFDEANIDYGVWELKEEIESGRLALTPFLEETFRRDELKREQYEALRKEEDLPVVPENSLLSFFQSIGQDYFCDYDGHIDLEKEVKRYAYSEIESVQRDGHPLRRTVNSPKSKDWGPEITPTVTDKDGTVYTFLRAKFLREDRTFEVQTKIAKDGKETTEWYHLRDLKNMIKFRKSVKKSLFAKVFG